MSPEQLTGDPIDHRADLYAAGLVLCELLTGRPAFPGRTALDRLEAMLRDEPSGTEEFPNLAPVLQRALQRRPEMRYPNADAMSIELSAARGAATQPAPPQIRLVVLPFRLIKDDAEIGFLGIALPEAITASLATVRTILVRSNLAAGRLGPDADPIRAGAELDVNHVLTGTIHRAGARLRVSCQLIEVPSERVAWSGVKEMPIGDLFELQDDISRHIVESLPIERPDLELAKTEVRTTARGYELFLRANQIAHDHSRWLLARTMYQECVAIDPAFAPAWVALGRVNQLIGKYLEEDVTAAYAAAAAAFQRAFQLQPSLSIGHQQFAYLEVEQGHPDRGIVRLVTQLRKRPNQPQLFAALCHVSRYCGLLDVSLAADAQARRLDPQVRSSVVNTHLLVADYASMLRAARSVADQLLAIARFELGQIDEAIAISRSDRARFEPGTIAHQFSMALTETFEGRDAAPASRALFEKCGWMPDGEFHFYVARLLSRSGQLELARHSLERALDCGFWAARAFDRDPWLADARQREPGYAAVAAAAWDRHRGAVEIFEAVGGYELLGLKREPNEHA
jgi:TolB-like protein